MTLTTSKYNSVITTMARPMPNWVADETDAARVAAYDAYSDMFNNVPETFRLALRGVEDKPVYVPSAAIIIEATNRYLAKDWAWIVKSVGGDATAVEAATAAMRNLFAREEMRSKFYSIKRNMLLKGDSAWHITLDASKAEGTRITISEIDPRNLFAIPDPSDIEKANGYYIVDLLTVGTNIIARRMEYRKIATPDQASEFGTPIGGVFSRLTFWEMNAWDDRYDDSDPLKPVATPDPYASDPGYAGILRGMPLPASVTALPVYHNRNKRAGGQPFGTSQIAGVETLIAAINQGASDEDIALALQGLGVYVTTSRKPVDEDGAEVEWSIAPGTVIEMASREDTFIRVPGIDDLEPSQDHLAYLEEKMKQSSGLSDVAVGRVDVQVAQSGVALRLEMAPILSGNEEKEVELRGRMDQMLHDLLFYWLPLDGSPAPDPLDVSVENSFGDPLPLDRAAIIAEVKELVGIGLMSKEFAVGVIQEKLGYQFPVGMLDKVAAEADADSARIAAELGAGAALEAA